MDYNYEKLYSFNKKLKEKYLINTKLLLDIDLSNWYN